MGHARHIGRVGALAVALGIGSAIAWPAGVAWAEPDTGTSVSPGGSGDSQSNTADDGPGSSTTTDAVNDNSDNVGDDDAVDDGDIGDDGPMVDDVEVSDDDNNESEPVVLEQDSDPVVVQVPEELNDDDDSPRPNDRRRTVVRNAPVEKPAPVVAPNAGADTSVLRAEQAPVEAPQAPFDVTPAVAPVVDQDLSVEPRVEEPAVTTALLSTLLLPGGTDSPSAPADSPLAWALLAFARRQGNQQSNRIGSGTPTVSTGELVDAAADDNNPPTGRVVVGSPSPFTGRVTGRVIGSDEDRDPLTYSGPTSTAKGTVVVSSTGRFTYTPTAAARHAAAKSGATDADKTDTFVVNIADGNGGVTAVSVTVRISPTNARPDASSVVGRPDPATGAVGGAIVADDPDDDALTFEASDPAKGSVVIDDDGSFVYTPTEEARDAVRGGRYSDRFDRFSVTVNDGHGGTDTITVTVAIAASDNAAPVPGEVTAGSPNVFNGAVRGQVRATDPDGDRLMFSGSTTTEKGTVFVTPAGRFVYTPTAQARHAAAATGAPAADKTDTFLVTVVDAYGGTAVVPVTVSIAPLNSAPTRARASAGSPDAETGAVDVTVTARDADRDPLTFTPAASEKGTVVDNGEGSFTFTPTAAARQAAAAPNAPEAARFETLTFTVDDGHGGTTTTTVRVAISPAATTPTNTNPTGGTFTAGQPDSDGTVTGTVSATDPDGDPLSYSGPATSTKGGTVVVNSDGSYTYDPTDAARHSASALGASTADTQDTFTVTVSDGNGGTLAVPVTVTILPRNAAPVGSYTAGSPGADGKVTGAVTSTDADNDARTYSGPATSVKGGTLVVNADGTFTYTPSAAARQNAAKAGATEADKPDSFVVSINDGHVGGTVTVTVSVAILPAANTAPANGTATVGQPDSSGKVGGTVSATDANGDQLTYSGSTSTSKGAVVVNADGTFVYTPTDTARHAASALGASSAVTQDTFTVTVSDGRGGILQVPVTVSISPSNAAPQGSFSAGAPASDGTVTGTVTSSDADGDARSYSAPTTSVKGGTVTFDTATGAFTYKPTAAMREQATQTTGVDTDTFTVTVTDGHGGSTPVQVTVTIAPNTVVTTESTPGIPIVGVIAAPGGGLYQVTTSIPGGNISSAVTRVSVITEDGRVLATTSDIAGFPSLPIAQPNGNLLVTVGGQQGGVTFVTVTPTGTLTEVLSLGTVTPLGYPVVGANGTAYFLTATSSAGGNSTLIAISGDQAKTYAMAGSPGGFPVVSADGTAYVAVRPTSGNTTSVLVVRPDGTSFTTAPIQGMSTLPMVVAGGSAYLVNTTVNETTGAGTTVVATITGDTVTTRTFDELPGSPLVVSSDGSVVLTLLTYAELPSYRMVRLTATSVTSSATVTGYLRGRPQVAPDGTAYLAYADAEDSGRLLVLRPGGGSSVINLPGQFAESNLLTLNTTAIGPDGKVYVPMVDDEGNGFAAIVSPTGVVTTRTLGGYPGEVPVIAPNGTAYQVVSYYDADAGSSYTKVVVLSNGASTVSLPGEPIQLQGGTPLAAVAPDGTGLLIVVNEDGSVRGLAFNSAGATLGTFTDSGTPTVAIELGGEMGLTGKAFVFAPDGTAYVTIIESTSDIETGEFTVIKSVVYAMGSAGVTKVLEVPGATATAPTVAPDGTVYVTTATINGTDGVTTVKVITPPSVL